MEDSKNSKPKKVRVLKKSDKPAVSVREKATASSEPTSKRRPFRRLFRIIWTPFRLIGRFIAKILKPFSFLLKPFKTKPARKIGRILASILLLNYFRESWKELKKVTWPNRKETIRLTIAVVVFALIFGIAIAVVDYGLDKLFRRLLLG